MDPATIIGLAGSIGGAALQTAGMFTNLDKTMELSEWLNGINIDNWNMVNEYNLPSNVMKRLKAAGINPYLVAGQLGSAGQAGAIPAAHLANSPDFSQVGQNLVSNFMNLYQGILSGSQTKATIDNINQNTANAKLKNAMDNYIFVHQFPWQTKNLQYRAENLLQNTILTQLNQQRVQAEVDKLQYENEHFLPIQLETLGYQRDASKFNIDWMLPGQLNKLTAETTGIRRSNYNQYLRNNYLKKYGIEQPGGSSVFGVPLSVVFGGADLTNRYIDSAKGMISNMFTFYKDLFGKSKNFIKELIKDKLLPGFQAILGGVGSWMNNSFSGVQPFK